MARMVFGMHGAGGNGSIVQGFGSNGDQPKGPDFYTAGGYDFGTTFQMRTPGGAVTQQNGLPACGGWHDMGGLQAYITACRQRIESVSGETIDSIIVHGFSYGGGGCVELCNTGYTDGGRVKGYVADDPAGPPGPSAGRANVPMRLYGCEGGPLEFSNQQMAAAWGIPYLHNRYSGGPGGHRPMTNVPGLGGPVFNGNQAPPDESLSGGTPQGESLFVPSMWTGGGPTEPPPTVTDAWPRFHAENATLLSPQPSGIIKILNTSTGALGTGFVGQWFQSPEGVRFAVNGVPAAGAYNIKVRYRQAIETGTPTRVLRRNGVNVAWGGNAAGTPISFPPNSSSWNASTWTELTIPNVTLSAGNQTIDFMFASGGGPDIDEITFEPHVPGGGGGTPSTEFDVKTNRAGFRSTGYVGGWDEEDEGLQWSNVQIVTGGLHRLKFRVANKGPNTAQRTVVVDGATVGTINVPVNATGDNDNSWVEQAIDVNLTAGTHTVRIIIAAGQDGQNVDIDEMSVWRVSTGGGGTDPDPEDPGTDPPTSGTESVVQAESGILAGGTSMAAVADNPGYRGSGYVGGWFETGTSVTLTLTAAEAGDYTLRFRYRNARGAASSRSWTVNGVSQTPLSFPSNAGTWVDNAWSDVKAFGIPLNSGNNTVVITNNTADHGLDLDEVGFILEGTGGGGNQGGGTTPTNVAVTVQAETGSFSDADPTYPTQVMTFTPGYNGSGFVENDWTPGDTITLTVTIPAGMAGNYALRCRYVNPETFSFSKNLTVNGVARGTVGPFPPTPGGYAGAWQNITRGSAADSPDRIPLNEGANTLVFTTTSEYGNLLFDEIEVTASIGGGGGGGTTTPPPTVGGARVMSGIQLFPADFCGYADVSGLPVHSQSATRIAGQAAQPTFRPEWGVAGYVNRLYPDFGSGTFNGRPFGFPLRIVPENQPLVPIVEWRYSYSQAESDPGPVPVPLDMPQEHNSDFHWLVLQHPHWLHEAWDAHPVAGGWSLGQYSRWDLRTNAMRPPNITSADAASMPILPLSVDYDEVAAGDVKHALRICITYCSAEHVWPANHTADLSLGIRSDLLRMGDWLRLKSSFDLNAWGLGPQAKAILAAFKLHGAIVIDIGPNWKINALHDNRWNNADLMTMHNIPNIHNWIELVNVSSLIENSRSMSTTQA